MTLKFMWKCKQMKIENFIWKGRKKKLTLSKSNSVFKVQLNLYTGIKIDKLMENSFKNRLYF